MDVDLSNIEKPCPCNRDHNVGTKGITIESGACEKLMDLLMDYQNPVFICDSNTRAIAEEFLEEEFKDYPIIELDPEGLFVDDYGINKVMGQLDYCDRGMDSVLVDMLVAIGGGTIHNLTKYAAEEYDIPFISIPTKASAGGFASSIVKYSERGVGKIKEVRQPIWVFADTDMLKKTSREVVLDSFEVLKERQRILESWEYQGEEFGEYFCEEIFDEITKAIRQAIRDDDDVLDGDEDAVEKLMYALLIGDIYAHLIPEFY